MKRRTFCKSTLAAAAAATFPACGSKVADPIAAVSSSGEELSLEAAAVQELSESFAGRLLLSADDGYETARKVWNGMIDRRPAMIAVCANATDVQNAVTFAPILSAKIQRKPNRAATRIFDGLKSRLPTRLVRKSESIIRKKDQESS